MYHYTCVVGGVFLTSSIIAVINNKLMILKGCLTPILEEYLWRMIHFFFLSFYTKHLRLDNS